MEDINKILPWGAFILVIMILVYIGGKATVKEGLNVYNGTCDNFKECGAETHLTTDNIYCKNPTCTSAECCVPKPDSTIHKETSANIYYPGYTMINFEKKRSGDIKEKYNSNADIYQHSNYNSWTLPKAATPQRTNNMFAKVNHPFTAYTSPIK